MKDKIKNIIEELEYLKTGHSSYSCSSVRNICVCGADEDRWNISLDKAIDVIKSNYLLADTLGEGGK